MVAGEPADVLPKLADVIRTSEGTVLAGRESPGTVSPVPQQMLSDL